MNRSASIKPEEMTSVEYDRDPFAHFGAHEPTLKDQIRTRTYRRAIYKNQHLFRGRTVLDVGCGMGILSLFAARAGASRVIAVDSSNVIDHARSVVEENGLGHVITLVQAKIELLEQLPHGIGHVDVILSEWMGFCLMDRPMLNAVIYARDKWLKPNGGVMFPDRCTLFVAGIEDRKGLDARINWWDRVYGFDMSPIRSNALIEPLVGTIGTRQLVTSSYLIKEVDMYSVEHCETTGSDLDIESPFHLIAKRDDFVHGLVTYFNVEFTSCENRIGFSTSPMTPFTHWRQMVFYLDEGLVVKKGEEIGGMFCMKSKDASGRYPEADFQIRVRFDGELSQVDEERGYQLR
ncbi:AAEL001333-PA [Aedes aegypti]|nr:AAEL001333-PA [Aedes aegypti]